MTRLLFCGVFLALAVACAFSAKSEAEPNEPVVVETLQAVENCERRSKQYDVLHVHYTGKLLNGNEFDSSMKEKPKVFRVGYGKVIRGWDEGLIDMCVGEKRKLTIPPSKGYGSQSGDDAIPPDSTLVFEVELVKISDEADNELATGGADYTNEFFDQIDLDHDNKVTKEEFGAFIQESTGEDPDGQNIAKNAGGPDVMTDKIFAQEDKNKDGIITRDELDKHHEDL